MTLLNLKITDLLYLWTNLVEAYYKVNTYGKDTCEIYAYRLGKLSKGDTFQEEVKRSEFEARDNLFELLDLFKESYNCDMEMDGYNLNKFKEIMIKDNLGFEWRIHIKIIQKGK